MTNDYRLVLRPNGAYELEMWSTDGFWVKLPTVIEQEPVIDTSAQSSMNA